MKNTLKYGIVIINILFYAIFICPDFILAQCSSALQCSFDGSIRHRFEKWHNINAREYGSQPVVGNPNDNILLQRIIAGTTLRVCNRIRLSVHLQDSRAFGWSLSNTKEPDAFKIREDNTQRPFYIMNPQEEFFEIYDANIRIDSILEMFSVIAGRQKIAFTDYRIFGPGSWGNTGRWSWDAVRLIVDRKRWTGGIWFGGTKIHDPNKTYLPFTHTEYIGGGVHGKIRLTGFMNTDFYVAHKNQGSADYIRDKSISRNWFGFRLYDPESLAWKYEVSGTYEYGRENSIRVNAYGLFLKFGYHFNQLTWRPCLTFRYTYASGNNPNTERVEKFDPAFGAGDRYYGWMNLVKWSNLDDREFMIEFFPTKGVRLELKYNRFNIPHPENLKINGNLELLSGKNHLGDEFDLFAKYDFNENWQFVTAMGYFVLGDARTPESDDPGNAFWISLQVLYRFNLKLS